ncbi:hypothetical protein L0Y25_09310 [Pectobacterium aroidearum]|uniref:hypothetical protein n=2 Tax=Pectobacterium aroidearum TaxID=1201031 RepID=UPI0021147E79|nr:hypothetical protein [Pectobacterium aroidearum]UUE42464.1 hypothetical protein L0Y25_09310 [Pectobacterium aroidearum]
MAAFSLLVLVMLFKKPDTVSAIADLCMAGAAIYAAWNAKDWLTPLKRNISFDELVKCIKDIEFIFLELEKNTFKEVALHTKSDEKTYMDKIKNIDSIIDKISSIHLNLIIIEGLGYKIDSYFMEEINKLKLSVKKMKEILRESQSITGSYKNDTIDEKIKSNNATIKIINNTLTFNEILNDYYLFKDKFQISIRNLLNP